MAALRCHFPDAGTFQAGNGVWRGPGKPSPQGSTSVMGRCFKGRLCSGRRRGNEVISAAWRAFPTVAPGSSAQPAGPELLAGRGLSRREFSGQQRHFGSFSSNVPPPQSWESLLPVPAFPALRGGRKMGWVQFLLAPGKLVILLPLFHLSLSETDSPLPEVRTTAGKRATLAPAPSLFCSCGPVKGN